MEVKPDPDPVKFMLRVPWGMWELGGGWRPNPLLAMSEEQQRAQNIAGGYACPQRS